MEKMKKPLILLIVAISLLTSFVLADTYDDFSGGTLDTALWMEAFDSSSGGDLDEYGLDTTNQNYHTAQISPGDKGRLLLLTQEFEQGDVLQYDVILQESSGNIISRLYLNGNYLDVIVGADSGGYATSGDIGYWSGESEIGNELGAYNVALTFNGGSADFEIINPSGNVWAYTVSGLTAPYTFGVATRTGSDGTGEIDYDNFEVTYTSATTGTTKEVNTTELQERVAVLETAVIDLQTQIDAFESASDDHETRIISLESAVAYMINKINILWRIIRP